MDFELQPISANARTLVGPNFSGRSASLQQWAKGRGSYLSESSSSAISGLQDTVAGELRFYCKSDPLKFQLAKTIAGELGLCDIWSQNPFAGECSGGQEAALVILCRLMLSSPNLALDVCTEQLSIPLRRYLYESAFPLFPMSDIRVVDNRIYEVFPMMFSKETHTAADLSIPHPEIHACREIRVENLRFAYRKGLNVIENFSTDLRSGVYHLRGRNGSGKSTIAKLLAGLLRPASGSISIDGLPTDFYGNPGRHAAFAFQDPNLQLFGKSIAPGRDAFLLNAFALQNSIGQHPLDLPWVLRKRLSVALALGRTTPIVILDEPTLGQDHSFCALLASILKIHATVGRVVIVITHSPKFAAMLEAKPIDLEERTRRV